MRFRRCEVWAGRIGRFESSGLESVPGSPSSFGSHSSSSAMASLRRVWDVSSFSVASAGRPVEASWLILSQVSHSMPVAFNVFSRHWGVPFS